MPFGRRWGDLLKGKRKPKAVERKPDDPSERRHIIIAQGFVFNEMNSLLSRKKYGEAHKQLKEFDRLGALARGAKGDEVVTGLKPYSMPARRWIILRKTEPEKMEGVLDELVEGIKLSEKRGIGNRQNVFALLEKHEEADIIPEIERRLAE